MSSSSRASCAAANNRGPPCHHFGTMLGLKPPCTRRGYRWYNRAAMSSCREWTRAIPTPAQFHSCETPASARSRSTARCVINFRVVEETARLLVEVLGIMRRTHDRRPEVPPTSFARSLSNGFGELPDQPPTIESSFSRTYGMTSRPRLRRRETATSPSFSPQPSGCRLRSASLSRSASAISLANRSTSLCHCLRSTWRR